MFLVKQADFMMKRVFLVDFTYFSTSANLMNIVRLHFSKLVKVFTRMYTLELAKEYVGKGLAAVYRNTMGFRG